MDLQNTTRREKRQTFFIAIALAAAVMILAAPMVQAAINRVVVTNTPLPVKVKGVAQTKGVSKIRDSAGHAINSEVIPDMGVTQVPGSPGAQDVRIYAGGTGLLGIGDCSTDTTTGPSNVLDIPGNKVITAFIMTGTGEVKLTSDATGPLVLSNFVTDANTPEYSLSLPNGLGTTVPLHFTGTPTTACHFVVLGEDLNP
jgi:hypothetical protein